MRNYATLLNQRLEIRTGKTIYAYKYFSPTNASTTAGYSSTESSPATYTEVGNGVYYLNVTSTFKATIAIVKADSTLQVTHLGVILTGDNEPTLAPPAT